MTINNAEQVPVNVVGSSIFGRYGKISAERTFNMFVSDNWLINFAGFKKRVVISDAARGRGFFHSIRGHFLIAVVGSGVYRIGSNLNPVLIGTIDSAFGNVSIDENLNSQICIVDGNSAYIYNYFTSEFQEQTLTHPQGTLIPNYVCYHNTFFLFGSNPFSENPQLWFAFEPDGVLTDAITWNSTYTISTKPDAAIAVKRIPGGGNNVIVFGSSVAEIWTQVGGAQEAYRRVQSFNIDNGVASVSTIAASEDVIAWLSQNENNAPCIMVTDGAGSKRISDDGIDYLLQTLEHPEQSTAFFFRQDGHLFYQLTFYNENDNLTLVYDFNTGLFFDLTNEDQNFHPANQVVFFNEKTYFISINDSAIYEMGTEFVTYDYNLEHNSIGSLIPRIRICKTFRRSDTERFRVGSFEFWIEQGVDETYVGDTPERCNGLLITETGEIPIITETGDFLLVENGYCFTAPDGRPRVDMCFSKNGNASFSNVVSRNLNSLGKYRNIMKWASPMGQANEFTVQLRFLGFQRFVANNGVLEIF